MVTTSVKQLFNGFYLKVTIEKFATDGTGVFADWRPVVLKPEKKYFQFLWHQSAYNTRQDSILYIIKLRTNEQPASKSTYLRQPAALDV